jgi:hypothetical protein
MPDCPGGAPADASMSETSPMVRWIARAVFLRFLPRRLLPILTAIELFRIVRGLRKQKQPVNEPIDSRTAPPPPLPRPVKDR